MATIYENGSYLESNPTWHEQDSSWKALQIKKILAKNNLDPKSVCEIGCGAGEILNQLSHHLDCHTKFTGYEISPQAYEICSKKSNAQLRFTKENLFEDKNAYFDMVMAIDVFEHVEDYFGFLRKIKEKGEYKIFHIPLDLSVQSVLRSAPIIKRRKLAGHIHYFTKETALETLKDTGYEIVDYAYTSGSINLQNKGWKIKLMKIPRRVAFMLNKDLAVRILGGFSLLVLAR